MQIEDTNIAMWAAWWPTAARPCSGHEGAARCDDGDATRPYWSYIEGQNVRDGSGVVERGLESPGLRLTRDGGAPRAGDRYEGGLGLPALGDIPEEAEGAVEASAPEPVDPGLYALARRGRGSTHVMPSEPGRLIDIVA